MRGIIVAGIVAAAAAAAAAAALGGLGRFGFRCWLTTLPSWTTLTSSRWRGVASAGLRWL